MAKLTQADLRLLRYPPTQATWECLKTRTKATDDGDVKVPCGAVNPGSSRKCWVCGGSKPAKPKLLYPVYLTVCKKAGIEPGTRWPVRSEPTEAAAPKKTRRKGNA